MLGIKPGALAGFCDKSGTTTVNWQNGRILDFTAAKAEQRLYKRTLLITAGNFCCRAALCFSCKHRGFAGSSGNTFSIIGPGAYK